MVVWGDKISCKQERVRETYYYTCLFDKTEGLGKEKERLDR